MNDTDNKIYQVCDLCNGTGNMTIAGKEGKCPFCVQLFVVPIGINKKQLAMLQESFRQRRDEELRKKHSES